MNNKFLKIFFLLVLLLTIIILVLPKGQTNNAEVEVLNFEIYNGVVGLDEKITLLLTLENTSNLTVDTVVINKKQVDKSSFQVNSTPGRIYIDYILTENDFSSDMNLYLVLEGLFLNESKINVTKTIYLRTNN